MDSKGAPIPSTSKIKWIDDPTRPLNDREILEMIEKMTTVDIPIDLEFNTDIEDDDNQEDTTEFEVCRRDSLQINESVYEDAEEQHVDDSDKHRNESEDEESNEGEEDEENGITHNKDDNETSKKRMNNEKASNSTKKKKIDIDRKWRKRTTTKFMPDYPLTNNEGAVDEAFVACESATDIFVTMIEPIVDIIVEQSNLYATQRHKTLNLKREELYTFIGINQIMGYHKLPSWRQYWSTSADLGVPIVSSAMTRDRFDIILSNLHVNDNSHLLENKQDKLYKLRPMIDKLNSQFSAVYKGTRELSVDESVILFKGRSSLKQYNPMKPIKRGYKLWCLCDQRGYTLKFEIYQGKNSEIAEKFKTFGLGERVVLQLTESEWRKHKIIFFDNYFTSLPLLEKLKAEQTLACGTIRSNREGVPRNFTPDKSLNRGQYDYRFSSMDIGIWKWKDNKIVYFASNYHGSDEVIIKRTQKDGSKLDVKAPEVVKDYNDHMGGVDHADRLRVVYGVDRRSKKWWHRLFWGLLDMAFVNSYVIYCNLIERIPLLEFRRNTAQGLLAYTKNCNKKKRSTDKLPTPIQKKRRGLGYSVPRDVRLTNRGSHWVRYVEKRGRCEVCSMNDIQSRPHSVCTTCKIHLCCHEKKNCFAKFHEIE